MKKLFCLLMIYGLAEIKGEDRFVMIAQSPEFGWKYKFYRWLCINSGDKNDN